MDAERGAQLVEEQALPETDQLIERLNDVLAAQGMPFKVAIVDIDDLILLDKNARYMTHETFANLVENIKKDGGLTSTPFCLKEGSKYKVLSGNHRVKGQRAAGKKKIFILYTDKELSRQEQIAIQLSHNAITGQDDPVILKELWEEIEDVSLKYYSGLDDKVLDELKKVTLEPLSEVRLDFNTITFVMLPEEVERLDKVLQSALETIATRDIYLGRTKDYDRALDALAKTQSAFNIRNSATSLMLILDVFERNQVDLAEGWVGVEGNEKNWVPLASIIGTDKVPVGAAKVIKKAVDRMVRKGDVTKNNLWQILEYLCAEYLSGGDDQ